MSLDSIKDAQDRLRDDQAFQREQDRNGPVYTPPGLRKPWAWVQPRNRAELIQRLLDAREYAVPQRERENLCSMAYEALRASPPKPDILLCSRCDGYFGRFDAPPEAPREGWKLLPTEPTREMLDAWHSASHRYVTNHPSTMWAGLHYSDDEALDVRSYIAMLAAAPSR